MPGRWAANKIEAVDEANTKRVWKRLPHLFTFTLKLDFDAIFHAPLNDGCQQFLLILALFLAGALFLGLHHKPWGHLALYHDHFIGAAGALRAFSRVLLTAAAAHYIAGNASRHFAAVVKVLQVNVHLQVRIAALLVVSTIATAAKQHI